MVMASAAQATVTIYTSQSSYLAAVGATGVDTFDDLTIDYQGTPFARNAGTYNYIASSGPDSGLYGAGDGADHYLATNYNTDTITFSNFSSGVIGVGGFFFGSDANGAFIQGGTMTLKATDAQGFASYTLNDSTKSSFIGFVSNDALASVTLTPGNLFTDGIWVSANDLTLAVSAVPEPESYAMLLAGLGLMGWMARRRKA